MAVSSTDFTLFSGKLNENINQGQDLWYKRESSTAGGEGLFIHIAIPLHTATAFQTASNMKRPQYMVLMGITQISIKVTKRKVRMRRGSTCSIISTKYRMNICLGFHSKRI